MCPTAPAPEPLGAAAAVQPARTAPPLARPAPPAMDRKRLRAVFNAWRLAAEGSSERASMARDHAWHKQARAAFGAWRRVAAEGGRLRDQQVCGRAGARGEGGEAGQ